MPRKRRESNINKVKEKGADWVTVVSTQEKVLKNARTRVELAKRNLADALRTGNIIAAKEAKESLEDHQNRLAKYIKKFERD